MDSPRPCNGYLTHIRYGVSMTRYGIQCDALRPYLRRDGYSVRVFAKKVGMAYRKVTSVFDKRGYFIREFDCLRICALFGIPASKFILPKMSQIPSAVKYSRNSQGLSQFQFAKLTCQHQWEVSTLENFPPKTYNSKALSKVKNIINMEMHT